MLPKFTWQVLALLCLVSACQEKVLYSGDDEINSTPFKNNLVKKGGKWSVSREDNYYSNDNQRDYYGYDKAIFIGEIEFTEEEPEVSIAGDLGSWTPENGNAHTILYQVTSRSSIQIAIYKWENNEMTEHMGYVAHLDWTKDEMIWEGHDNSVQNDTLILHRYYFKRI